CITGPLGCRERVLSVVLCAGGNGTRGGVDECDLRGKEVAEETRYAPRHVDTRAADRSNWQHLDAGHAACRGIPRRPTAHEGKTLRNLFAAGAQRGATPQIDYKCARHLAVRLQIVADYLFGREAPKFRSRRRAQCPRIRASPLPP